MIAMQRPNFEFREGRINKGHPGIPDEKYEMLYKSNKEQNKLS